MKIYTRVVFDMVSDQVEHAVSEEYTGPLALAGGGGSNTTQNSQQLDPRIANAYFGQNGDGGLVGEATSLYNKHKQQPYNDVQKQAITGMMQYFTQPQGNQQSGNDLANKFLGGVGVAPTQLNNYQAQPIDLNTLFSPQQGGATTFDQPKTTGLLSTPSSTPDPGTNYDQDGNPIPKKPSRSSGSTYNA